MGVWEDSASERLLPFYYLGLIGMSHDDFS